MASHILLRTPSDGKAHEKSVPNTGGVGQQDSYETLLAPATSVPVYETMHTLEELQWILETGPAFHGYKGVIVTSKRAVDAWAAAARKVPPPVDERAQWTDIPFYTVGGATTSAIRDLFPSLSTVNATHLAPRQVLGGEEAGVGTGEQLGHFILSHLASQREAMSTRSTATAISASGSYSSTSLPLTGSVSTDNLSIFTSTKWEGQVPLQGASIPSSDRDKDDNGEAVRDVNGNGNGNGNGAVEQKSKKKRSRTLRRPTKLLFLVGDKTRDVLPDILASDESIELDSVQVYATKPSPNFPNALRNAVLAQPKVKDWWIVVFAPSGADYALPYLREHFTLPSAFTSSPISPSSPTYPPTPTSPTSVSLLNPSSFKSKKKDKKKDKVKGGNGGGGGQSLPAARIAAIGPTTATHLKDVCKLEVAAVASKPNAEALVEAIEAVSAK